MDNKKFEEGIDFFAQLFGSFLELRKMGYTQEEINWAYNTMSGNFVPNFDIKNLSNLIESRKENWKVNKKNTSNEVFEQQIYKFLDIFILTQKYKKCNMWKGK